MATSLNYEDSEQMNTSYLNARLASIVAQNGPNHAVLDITNIVSSTCIQPTSNLQTYLRLRKSKSQSLFTIKDDNTLLCKPPQALLNNVSDNIPTKVYTFSKIFGPETSQSQMFVDVVQNRMVDFINGANCTLLTYGASGAGKTYTMVGNSNEPGIIPRSLEFLFRTLPNLAQLPSIKPTPTGKILRLSNSDSSNEYLITNNLLSHLQDINNHREIYSAMQRKLQNELYPIVDENISDIHLSVWISFAEIYNEHVYDLLVPALRRGQARKKLRLGYGNNKAYVKDLTYVNISSASDCYCILQYALQNLKYAATTINHHSSRSHSIYTILLAQASDTKDGISVSTFNFCDLAGSERLKKTNNVGDRLKESNSINTSLMVLGRCISAIRDMHTSNITRAIPFRESKLTQLLQNALSGKETIFMVVNINPILNVFDESMHVLNFSAIAKEVTLEKQEFIKRHKNQPPNEANNLEDLKMQCALLCKQTEKEEADYQEEREYVIKEYKKMIENTNTFWMSKCEELVVRIAESKRYSSDFTDDEVSVVVIDSCSDEEAHVDADINVTESSKKRNYSVSGIDSYPDEQAGIQGMYGKNRKKKLELQDDVNLLKNQYDINQISLENTRAAIQNKKELIKQNEAKSVDLQRRSGVTKIIEQRMNRYEEQGKPRRSSGALCSVKRYANPANTVTVFNYQETLQPIVEDNTYIDLTYYPTLPPLLDNYGQIGYQPPESSPLHYIQQLDTEYAELVEPSNIEENVQHVNVAQFEEACGGEINTFVEMEDTEESEALKLQNLGESYEKEYGQYMYDSNNPITSESVYHPQHDRFNTEDLEISMNQLYIANEDDNVERIPYIPGGFISDVNQTMCVPNKPMYALPHVFFNWSGVLDLNQAYKEEIAEYVDGIPLLVLASENYDPYKKLCVFTMNHIVEIYKFPASFYSKNLLNVHRENPRYLKWCDDTHALLVTGSEDQAKRALKIKNRYIKSRPLTEGSPIAITIACQYILRPAGRMNPENQRGIICPERNARGGSGEFEYQAMEWPSQEDVPSPVGKQQLSFNIFQSRWCPGLGKILT
ncbi:hypothetical protein RN001_015848 [Aquatica leii]|uniref:Kinesin motor domain-containing protein n=1 Tax=Aquatica leii TaxID=1421715 RepID=A0AAN7SB34_9COLE|nr:hypothetical protein RN001_015848 [Aquatica leii]